MSKMTQRAAVLAAVSTVLHEAGIKFEMNQTQPAKELMTKEHRAQVNQILFDGFKAGDIELDGSKTDTELKSYVSGLQSNWLNKARELNGNVQYAAKNPGSRAGSGDPQLKALKALQASKTDTDEIAEIQGYIDARLATLGEGKKQVVVNYDDLPEELKAKYAKN